jgi:hypothetical protein
MFSKMLTTSQHKQNKKYKNYLKKQNKKFLEKNEKRILLRLNKFPEDVIKLLYTYVDYNVKFNLSFYRELFNKYICPPDKTNIMNLSSIFRGYPQFNYCTHDKTALPIKYMLNAIPLDKLQKYVYFGSPSKYFNIAFPLESNIIEYIENNYFTNDITSKDEKTIKTIYKNYIFEVLDLISYFTTRANKYHSWSTCKNNKYFSQLNLISNVYPDLDDNQLERKLTKEDCEENEKITRKLILSILFIYEKYGTNRFY